MQTPKKHRQHPITNWEVRIFINLNPTFLKSFEKSKISSCLEKQKSLVFKIGSQFRNPRENRNSTQPTIGLLISD